MRILPREDSLSAPYWAGARQGQLLLQCCRGCATFIHPPLPMCPQCRGQDLDWKPSQGRGTVHSFTVVHHAAHPAMKDRVPYLVALVTLDDGPRMVCNIVNTSGTHVAIG
ncbi:MAG: OB-fold domain-containing protein, partial [Burkholderiaceae bacterium]|nr:OB-fold domain-containing protein [Burkholderiaceae bacterium]